MIVSFTQYIYIMLFESLVLVVVTSIIYSSLGVTIGFNITEYSVSEDAGNVSATVSVLNGTLARDVSVSMFTSADSAGKKNKYKLHNKEFT